MRVISVVLFLFNSVCLSINKKIEILRKMTQRLYVIFLFNKEEKKNASASYSQIQGVINLYVQKKFVA